MKRAILLILILTTILLLSVAAISLFVSLYGLILSTGGTLSDFLVPLIVPFGAGFVLVIGYWVLFFKGWFRAALLVALGGWLLAWFSLSLFGFAESPVDSFLDAVGTIEDWISLSATRPSNSTSRNLEITENPSILLDVSTPVTDLKLVGVKLGDPKEKIPKQCSTDYDSTDTGTAMFRCGNDIRISAINGRIHSFELSYTEDGILKQLGIHSQNTLRRRLGSDVKTETSMGRDFVDYSQPGRSVTWNVHKHLIAEIDIGSTP